MTVATEVREHTAARVASMRERVLSAKRAPSSGSDVPYARRGDVVTNAQSLRASEDETSWQRRRGRVTRDKMRSWTFLLDEHEQLVGRPVPREVHAEDVIASANDYLAQYPPAPGMTGHCELDMTRAMSEGIDGLSADIAARRARSSGDRADTYASFLDVLQGLSDMLETMGEVADAATENASPGRAAELTSMAEACRHVAHRPPRTVRQALQLYWAVWLGVSFGDGAGCICPGHIDRWLLPVFERDRRENGLSDDEALFLLENLFLLINACWVDGSAISVMVGGRDASGNDVTNALSHLCLEALRRTALCYPTVGIAWHEGTPPDLLDRATGLVSEGYSTPAFFGEESIRKGMRSYGTTAADASCFINSACVEITPSGASNVWVASPYFSMCKHLLEEIDAQVATKSPAPDFDAFLEAYLDRMSREIGAAVEHLNALRRGRLEHGRFPLQSVFTRDCIARGQDLDEGGAIYNWVECSFVGLANLVDSLQVLREEVFGRARMTLRDLRDVLTDDFAGHEDVRRRFLEGHPKYGQDEARVDGLMARVLTRLQAICATHEMEPDDSPFVPGAFCWVMHQRLGGKCGATPDGRAAGTPFADGCGPAQGREAHGPTAAILSTTSWDHTPMIGGLAYNMKFNSSLFGSTDAVARLRDLIVTYLRRGGFETQINVVDHETLREAKKNPDGYRDLIVRIGGYTDYFTRLCPEMQDEVMRRTEFNQLTRTS